MADEDWFDDLNQKIEGRFKQLDANRTCPICRSEEWFLLNKQDERTVLFVSFRTMLPTNTLCCVRCGYVQQFIEESVLNGLNTGEVKADGE